MEQDQRLTPLPNSANSPVAHVDQYAGYSPLYDEVVIEGRRNIRQYINVVYKRLPLILALTLMVTAAAAFYMYRQPTVYQSSAQLVIEPRRPKVTSKDAININFGNDVNYLNTQLQLLQGPELKRRVVMDLGLYRDATLMKSQSKGMLPTLGGLFSGGSEPETPTLCRSSPTQVPQAAKTR
jgi:uncharacterized protein involved in exopolysaccharide biosynthesis